jgi:hypothetical protein
MTPSQGRRLCDALGLPRMTTSIVITVSTDAPVTVTAKFYPDDFSALIGFIETLNLVEQPKEPAAKEAAK